MNNTLEKEIILYMHAGSGNHGCEAIANSIGNQLKDFGKLTLISYYANEDSKYSLRELYNIVQERSFNNHKFAHLLYYAYRLITKDKESFIRYRYKGYLSKKNQANKYPVAVSIGGDNYCYDMMLNDLFLSNSMFIRQGTKTVLLGCSIEPDSLERKEILDDLKKYSLIIARESVTYDALIEKLDDKERIVCLPDPAFSLKSVETELPGIFNNKSGVVGLNISPMIIDNESDSGIVRKNYEALIESILNDTDMSIALIPHVIWDRNDDRKPIKSLYDQYKDSGRIVIVDDMDCQKLKYIISKCRFFIGARTHSTIAAYSSYVPTLVVGYSVKARGIAKDIGMGDYVIPVQSLNTENQLTEAFIKLKNNESSLIDMLNGIMPGYIEKSRYNGTKIIELLNK